MSKKRNLAVLMAAATVATSVAPVFAAEVKDLDEASLISQVEKLLATKYADKTEIGGDEDSLSDGAYANSVYKIYAGEATKDNRIKSLSDLESKIELAKVNGDDLEILVLDKGHKEVDGKIVKSVETKNIFINNKEDLVAFADKLKAETVVVRDVTYLGLDGEEISDSTIAETIKVELVGGKTFNISVGDYALDLTKGLDAANNKIEISSTMDPTVAKKVVGFELDEVADGKATYKPVPGSTFAKYTFGSNVVLDKNVTSYYTIENGYTEAGANLVNKFKEAQNSTEKKTTVVVDGVRYQISTKDISTTLKATADGYELTIDFEYAKADSELKDKNNVKLVIKSSTQEDLARIKSDITANFDNEVVAGRITYLAGDNRFDTAVEISKEAYEGYKTTNAEKKADAVVLVGENAIVDGLASAPLAKAKNAPILLTKANGIPAQTMAEIKRVVDKGSDIYIVGGTTTISKDVETALKNELNASIIRVAGDDRYATSSAIAEKLDAPDKAFVVGGTGLADAMSIASYAAQEGAPILVTPADKLGKDAKSSLKDLSITDATVIGGAAHVSTQVLKDLKDDANVSTPVRISGSNRANTNAEVLKSFYATDVEANRSEIAFIAKDGSVGGDGQLIDALAVAPFAAKEEAPLVLAGNDLTTKQDEQIKESVKETSSSKLYQVGQGIGADAIKSVLKALGL